MIEHLDQNQWNSKIDFWVLNLVLEEMISKLHMSDINSLDHLTCLILVHLFMIKNLGRTKASSTTYFYFGESSELRIWYSF